MSADDQDRAFDRANLGPRDTRRDLTVPQVRRAATLARMADVEAATFLELERVRRELEEVSRALVVFAVRRYGAGDWRWRLVGLLGDRVVGLATTALMRLDARGPVGSEQAGRDRVVLAVADATLNAREGASPTMIAKRAAEVALGLRGAP